MRVGIAADHGFELKENLAARLRNAGHNAIDFGAHELKTNYELNAGPQGELKR